MPVRFLPPGPDSSCLLSSLLWENKLHSRMHSVPDGLLLLPVFLSHESIRKKDGRDGKPVNLSGLPDSFSTKDSCFFFYCHLFNQFLLFHTVFHPAFIFYSAFFLFLYPLIISTSIPTARSATTISIPIPAFSSFPYLFLRVLHHKPSCLQLYT